MLIHEIKLVIPITTIADKLSASNFTLATPELALRPPRLSSKRDIALPNAAPVSTEEVRTFDNRFTAEFIDDSEVPSSNRKNTYTERG